MSKKNPRSDVRDRILAVARELFIRNGYEGTSIRDIAAASDTNVAHIKYYFNSKHHLFELIFDEAFNILVNRIMDNLESDKPFFEMVESWISIYYEILPEYPQIPVFLMNEINRNPDILINKINTRDPEMIFYKLSALMKEEVKKGNIREIPAIDFGLNILSLSVFPFMFGGIALKMAKISREEYNDIMAEHKKYVISFVRNALTA